MVVTGRNSKSFDGVTVLDEKDAPMPKSSYTIKENTLTVTGKAGLKVKLVGLAAGTYTVDAGGNHFVESGGALTLDLAKEYTSVYQTNGANKDGTVSGPQITENGPVSIEIGEASTDEKNSV